MNDLEICKRIAEIEGLRNPSAFFRPLSDDAQTFRLMVKYKIQVDWIGLNQKVLKPNCCAYWLINSSESVSSESANKAICLAIIEAHKQ